MRLFYTFNHPCFESNTFYTRDMNTKTTAKDFFLHLGLIISMYSGVSFLLNLLFNVIDSVYPKVVGYSYNTPSISLPVAALIIITPVFLIIASLIAKIELADPAKKDIWVSRWTSYLTLFLAGAIVVGDLIAVVYFFLDGQDLTAAFLLKVLSILIVLGAIFGYTLSNLSRTLSARVRMIWRVGAIVLVAGSIVLGFTVIGSPRTQRLVRYDAQKVSDLQNIQSQVLSYWQMKKSLPVSVNDLNDDLSYFVVPTDPETGMEYEYSIVSPTTFKICATFNLDSKTQNSNSIARPYDATGTSENWNHQAGKECFERTIDPERYPPFNKNL
jgi:hypothetical protein